MAGNTEPETAGVFVPALLKKESPASAIIAASARASHLHEMPRPRAKPSKPNPKAAMATGQGRSLWTGQLRLALVSVPVQLVSAVKTGARIAFHQVDQKSGKRIRYEKVAPGIGKVEAENIVKGFEISKGKYVFVSDEDIENVKIEAKRTIDLIQFVDHCEIDPIYFDKPYYVLPDGDLAEEAFSVLRDALRATGKMGLGQFVMRGREYVVALKPCGAGMMLETLRFSDEVRDAAPFFADVGDEKPNKELLDLAKELIGRKSRRYEPGQFHDHYTEALRALIEAKAKNRPVEVDEDDGGGNRGNVIDLVEALRRSVRENEAPQPAARAKASAKPKAAAPPKRARAK
jgi:DNA end-binding protein Ku